MKRWELRKDGGCGETNDDSGGWERELAGMGDSCEKMLDELKDAEARWVSGLCG